MVGRRELSLSFWDQSLSLSDVTALGKCPFRLQSIVGRRELSLSFVIRRNGVGEMSLSPSVDGWSSGTIPFVIRPTAWGKYPFRLQSIVGGFPLNILNSWKSDFREGKYSW